MILVLIVSILLFSVLPWSSTGLRVFLKLLLLPVVMGISYELIKLAGRYDNLATRIISAPGLWLQRLTTFEPVSYTHLDVYKRQVGACAPGRSGLCGRGFDDATWNQPVNVI